MESRNTINEEPAEKSITGSVAAERFCKPNLCECYEDIQLLLIKPKGYRKYRLFYNNVFQSKLRAYRASAEEYSRSATPDKMPFDFLDKKLNSPLHVASQNGHTECI
jgi:hypothetical protein